MEAVLPIEYCDFDHTVEETGDISNMSVEEYLSWVRHQASQLPVVFRADIDCMTIPKRQTPYMPAVEQILQCSPAYLPSEEWELDIIHSFSELRMSIDRLSGVESSRERQIAVPQMKDRNAWRVFCLQQQGGDEHSDCSDQITNSTLNNIVNDEPSAVSMSCDDDTNNDTTIVHGSQPQLADQVISRKRQLEASLGLNSISTVVSGPGKPAALLGDSECAEMEQQQGEDDADDDDEEGQCYPDVDPSLRCNLSGDLPVWTGARGVAPSTAVLLQFDQVLTQKVLAYHADWLEEQQEQQAERPYQHVHCIAPSSSQWIYGLLARLEKPVCQATMAVIRQIYRTCCKLRHRLSAESSHFDADLAALNVLISITGSYFGQGEAYVAFNHSHHAAMSGAGADCEDDEEEEEGEDEEYYRLTEGGGGDEDEDEELDTAEVAAAEDAEEGEVLEDGEEVELGQGGVSAGGGGGGKKQRVESQQDMDL